MPKFALPGWRLTNHASNGVARRRARWIVKGDAKTGKLRQSLKQNGFFIYSLAVSPSGKTLAGGYDDMIGLWNMHNGKFIGRIGNTGGEPISALVFAGNTTIATGGHENLVTFWNAGTGKATRSLANSEFVDSLAFDSKSQILASAGLSKKIQLWDVRTGKLIRTLGGLDEEALSVAFSPDGGLLASGGSDKTVRLWKSVNEVHRDLTPSSSH